MFHIVSILFVFRHKIIYNSPIVIICLIIEYITPCCIYQSFHAVAVRELKDHGEVKLFHQAGIPTGNDLAVNYEDHVE